MKIVFFGVIFTLYFRITTACDFYHPVDLQAFSFAPKQEKQPEAAPDLVSPDSTQYIDEFLEYYADYGQYWYLRVSEIVHRICEDLAQRNAIQALVTHRVKSLDSLRKKIENRSRKNGGYRSIQDIKKDIIDLAGVRIALYVPQQMDEVGKFIKERFNILDGGIVEHKKGHDNPGGTYSERYPGYQAMHYQIRLTKDDLKGLNGRSANAVVEIQVVTILHHIWANAQHDIEYKALGGSPSEDEKRMMDLLNGLMLLGEKHLAELHNINLRKIQFNNQPFANKWELGRWLSNWLLEQSLAGAVNLGPVEVLKRFLGVSVINKDTPEALRNVLEQMGFSEWLSPALSCISHRFDPPETRISILIIAHLLWGTRDDGTTRIVIDTSDDSLTYRQRVHIMMSAILWIDDIFQPVSQWERALTEYNHSTYSLEGLKWLLRSIEPREMLAKEVEASRHNRILIDGLWDWFCQHTVAPVTLTFSISRFGVLRDLPAEEEYIRLGKINHLLEYFL